MALLYSDKYASLCDHVHNTGSGLCVAYPAGLFQYRSAP